MFQSSYINDAFYEVPFNLVPMAVFCCGSFKWKKDRKYNSIGFSNQRQCLSRALGPTFFFGFFRILKPFYLFVQGPTSRFSSFLIDPLRSRFSGFSRVPLGSRFSGFPSVPQGSRFCRYTFSFLSCRVNDSRKCKTSI